ncbi:GtrA family protein [Actinacidiphila rubida]|uniref:Putative flippase GtrA (Transmembrane translocase of bactoprenol-linked glucose) n=1 Tax=Actinacidiphila rubida TaxID=310780 RepID=A0A1H8E6L7_9ACTN|nr:GtrA family protein [Actinacidiphila rubida]SEN15073.1 Putative flippase GtrA (transmembrane translocase of bactoprenol-linked glucose) [Actinacidiphila rubida]
MGPGRRSGRASDRGSGRRAQSAQILRFVLVGVVNTATFYGCYRLLLPALPYFAAYTLAFLVSMAGSFLMNTYFTYRTRPSWRKFALFPLTNVTNYLVQSAGLFALVDWLGMSEKAAPLVAAAVAVPFTYLLSRRILVPPGARRAPAPDPTPAPAPDPAPEPDPGRGTAGPAER